VNTIFKLAAFVFAIGIAIMIIFLPSAPLKRTASAKKQVPYVVKQKPAEPPAKSPVEPPKEPVPAPKEQAPVAKETPAVVSPNTEETTTEESNDEQLPKGQPLPSVVKGDMEIPMTRELMERQWPKVSLRGMREQILDAQVKGVNCVWKNISPGYTNVIYDTVVDNGVITFILDGAGLVQSIDGAKTWKQISYNLSGAGGFNSFDISPANPKIIITAGSYLDRTLDGGKTWSSIEDKALPPYSLGKKIMFGRVRFNSDGSRVFSSFGAFGHGLETRWDYEKDMAEEFGKKKVYVGDASGANFQVFNLGPFAGIRTIYPHPRNPQLVYLSFSDGELFVTRNAKDKTPTFDKLEVPEGDGYEIIDINASPSKEGELLLTMQLKDNGGQSKVLLAKDKGGNRLECSELEINGRDGKSMILPKQKIVTAQWNPRVRDQIFVGSFVQSGILVSDNGSKIFHKIPFPQNLKCDESLSPNGYSFYADPTWFRFDRKDTNLAVCWSAIGAWCSSDKFKTWEPLLMTYDDHKKLYGNKGAGFAECAVNIFIRKNNAYMVTNDHGAFRSDGADYTKWKRITNNPGIPRNDDKSYWTYMYWPMSVSEDEKYLYLVADELPVYSYKSVKLLQSTDRGDSWKDITSHVNGGGVLSFYGERFGVKHGQLIKILFDPSNSENQWLMFTDHLFFSSNGGKTFKEEDSPIFLKDAKTGFSQIAFDAKHKVLYLANRFSFAGGASLARSRDYGATWEPLDLGIGGYPVFNVTGSGNLVISGADGKLAVVPYERINAGKIESDMVKIPKGDVVKEPPEERGRYNPIYCDGEDILAFYTRRKDKLVTPLGPVLSRDGGKTFQWINYNLPCKEGLSAAIGDGKIIIGNRGVYYWKYK